MHRKIGWRIGNELRKIKKNRDAPRNNPVYENMKKKKCLCYEKERKFVTLKMNGINKKERKEAY